MGDDLYTQLKTWPKIDLDRHLEGSLRLKTLSEIAKEFIIDIPGYDLEAIRPLEQITDEPRTFLFETI
jgi:adenosine deaminase